MKVVGILCSPRKGGNTEIMLREALEGAGAEGAETELITISDKKINPCDGCGSCDRTGECKINDDMQDIYLKLKEADGIIFGTPVYFLNVTAQAKIIIDRTYSLRYGRKLTGKVASAVVVARRVGAGAVLSQLYTYFIAQRMIVIWGAIGYGNKRGSVKEGAGGVLDSAVEEARRLGKNVVSAIQKRYHQRMAPPL